MTFFLAVSLIVQGVLDVVTQIVDGRDADGEVREARVMPVASRVF
jgi:hypothetical protein